MAATSIQLQAIRNSIEQQIASYENRRSIDKSPDYKQTRRDVAVSTVTTAISRAGGRIGDPEIVRNPARGEQKDMWDLNLKWSDPSPNLYVKVAHLGVELGGDSMQWEIRTSLDQLSVAVRRCVREAG